MIDSSVLSDQEGLCIGDYVLLRDIVHGGFLSTEGILSEDVVLNEDLNSFFDSLFCVHLQRQYSASRDLQAFLQKYGDDKQNHDESTEKYLYALKRGCDNERKLNDTYMKKKFGQKVLFGDIIQLYHVRSNKYLTLIPDVLAKDERENSYVSLDANGSSYSWLQLIPRYKIDKDGDRFLNHNEVYLKFSEKGNEFLHTAEKDIKMGQNREVNCALELTSWKISIYQHSIVVNLEKDTLFSGDIISLIDPETNSALTVRKKSACEEGIELKNKQPQDFLVTESESLGPIGSPTASSMNRGRLMKRNYSFTAEESKKVLTTIEKEKEKDNERKDSCFSDSFNNLLINNDTKIDIILEPYDNETINSNFLWLVFRVNRTEGGPLSWRNELFQLKHLNSSKYLYINLVIDEQNENSDDFHVVSASSYENFVLHSSNEFNLPSNSSDSDMLEEASTKPSIDTSMLTLLELNSTKKYLFNGRPIQIGNGSIWLERGNIFEGSLFTYKVKATRDKTKALRLVISRFEEKKSLSSAFVIEQEKMSVNHNQYETLDVFSSLAARRWLYKYSEIINHENPLPPNYLWSPYNPLSIEYFQLICNKIVYFSQGFPISSNDIQLGIDKGDNSLIKKRQNFLREQEILLIVLKIIYQLIPISEKLEEYNRNVNKSFSVELSENEYGLLNAAQLILFSCINVIYYSILENHENQLYVADYMPILLAHLNVQPLAGKCVTEMLSKNMLLQETKIGTREIQIFIDKLRTTNMNSMYLNLLQACCSCQGDGVDSNQYKVANLLFGKSSDIIIKINYDDSITRPFPYYKSLYLPPFNEINELFIMGKQLLIDGIPNISLSWITDSIEYSPLGLYNKLSVSLEEIFSVVAWEQQIELYKQYMQHQQHHQHQQQQMQQSNLLSGRVSTASPSFKYSTKTRDNKQQINPQQYASHIAQLNKIKNKCIKLEQKQAVANFFIAQLFLASEMCLDRNYVAMHKLDPLYPFDVLLMILKMDVIIQLKAACVRLMMCLHVDRDPQATTKIPCLTRLWSEIKRNPEPQLPFVPPKNIYSFGLIQQIISEHIRGMAGNQWDELSRHMLKMLRTLVTFNYYGTNERLKDVIGPLIAALDRRKIQITSTTMTLNASSSRLNSASQALESTKNTSFRGNLVHSGSEKSLIMESISINEVNQFEEENFFKKCINFVKNSVNTFINVNRAIGLIDDNTFKPMKLNARSNFVSPLRYSKAPIFELETMVDIVDILAFVQKVIEDRNISLLLRYFYEWESGNDRRSASELFEQVVTDAQEVSLDISDFDNIMIDTLMFDYTPLVQSSLEVLMCHHSMRKTLLENAKNVQILASPIREKQFKDVEEKLKTLEQNAETHELWGSLKSEGDKLFFKQTIDTIQQLIEMAKIRSTILDFDEEFIADTEVQDLFRNLGLFDIAMKVMSRLYTIENSESTSGKATREMCLLCNSLIFWFILNNEKNQELAYQHLQFFLSTLDDGIKSHNVIKAIFKNNEHLIRLVPHSYLTGLFDKIVKNKKSHHYLSLFSAISHVGQKNILENQFEIVKILTSPGVLEKISMFMVPVNSPAYQIKRELMKPFKDKINVKLDDLPSDLAYHLELFEVLSGCTVGKMNVTAVEAKVQSVVSYVDLIESILDDDSIIINKLILSRFLYNAVIEVELIVPSLERNFSIWKLLDSYQSLLTDAKSAFQLVSTEGWENSNVDRLFIEYVMISIFIINGFFSYYYDPTNIHVDVPRNEIDKFTPQAITSIIHNYQQTLSEIASLSCNLLSPSLHKTILVTLETLRKFGSKHLGTSSKNFKVSNKRASVNLNTKQLIQKEFEDNLIKKYSSFLMELESDRMIQYLAENENVSFITILEKLPFIADPVQADVRYETLIKKLVFHIRENIRTVNNQKRMDSRVIKTSIWIIRAFRTMIENRMGMSIYDRDSKGGEEQDIAAAPVVNALNSCGATTLCLDLIAGGIDERLQLEAIRLGVGLLFKEGGAYQVQKIMHKHLSKGGSEFFFQQARQTIQHLQNWHTWNQVNEIEKLEPPDGVLIIRFLQLMCEGHYLPNQELIREQPNNRISYNLLDDFVSYLNHLSRYQCKVWTTVSISLSTTILEMVQGPCEANQIHLALNTELIETLNRINRSKLVNDCVIMYELTLKKLSILIFQGLLEGQGERSVVYERVLSVIHLDIIQMMSKGYVLSTDKPFKSKDTAVCQILQTECIVLLQMLCNFKPSLYEELGISRKLEDILNSNTAMIEVVWRGEIHRRFFHVPKVCQYLAKSSKDLLVENVDRSNAENKLIDFLNRSHELYREVKHQQLLTNLGLSHVFSRENQNRATWLTFFLAIVINVLYLFTYTFKDDRPDISNVIDYFSQFLNLVQVSIATFTLLLWLFVRSPIIYQQFQGSGYSQMDIIFKTATDPFTLYLVVYLFIALLGVFVANYYCSLLLLDIVAKNSSTRDILNSIVTPYKQLIMAFILEVIIIYIYAFFIFSYYRDDIEPFCSTLFNCMKVTLSYGLQNGGGIGDSFDHSQNARLILDLTFFIVVLVIMINVFLGMIIDTFSSLRVEKIEKLKDTREICFICGIHKQIFDRTSDQPDGFRTHIKIDHNMWNYLYFIFMLWEQDQDDDDGLEQYIRRSIQANEISWFPLNKALRLDRIATRVELMRESLNNSVEYVEELLVQDLEEFKDEVSTMLKDLICTLKQDNYDELPPGYINPLTDLTKSNTQDSDDENDVDKSLRSSFNEMFKLSSDSYDIKNINLYIQSIEGITLEPNVTSISCRVVFENSIHMFVCKSLKKKSNLSNLITATFGSHTGCLTIKNVLPDDKRQVEIQILTTKENNSIQNYEILAHFFIDVSDLDKSTDTYVHNFEQLLITESKQVCFINFVIN